VNIVTSRRGECIGSLRLRDRGISNHDQIHDDEQLRRDVESLHVLPLATLPLKTTILKRARLIKDARLNTVVSLFSSKETGAGVLDIAHLTPETLDASKDDLNDDLGVLCPVAQLFSFDVYSLRICLRHLGIPVAANDYLKLSPHKQTELRERMRMFTLPLIKSVYGNTDVAINEFADIIKLFSNPDVDVARRNLELLSQRLAVKVQDIPKFLEDFSDIYLSLAYYQQNLDEIAPRVEQFVDDMRELRKNWQLGQDARTIETFDALELNLNNLVAAITGRFESFNRNTENLWQDIDAEKFRERPGADQVAPGDHRRRAVRPIYQDVDLAHGVPDARGRRTAAPCGSRHVRHRARYRQDCRSRERRDQRGRLPARAQRACEGQGGRAGRAAQDRVAAGGGG
jgi:hypothetical protein